PLFARERMLDETLAVFRDLVAATAERNAQLLAARIAAAAERCRLAESAAEDLREVTTALLASDRARRAERSARGAAEASLESLRSSVESSLRVLGEAKAAL